MNFFEHGFGFGFDFRFGLILNRMRDINRIVISAAQRTGLRARGSHKFRRRDGHCRDAEVFEFRHIVQTARRARPSIGQGFDHAIAARLPQMFDDGFGRGFGEGGLGDAHNFFHSKAIFEQAFQMIQKQIAAGLADVEQADGFAR